MVLGIKGENKTFFEKRDLSATNFTLRHYLGYNCPVIRAGMLYLSLALGVSAFVGYNVGLGLGPALRATCTLYLQALQAPGRLHPPFPLLPFHD
ncbi:MAG: hypothetical protein P4M11_07700 [Candidatus Pacebacteria bacterium]|nr:hypothetical protein [Candidatus Paceibacterota bacterium]